MEDLNKRRRNFLSLFKLERGPYKKYKKLPPGKLACIRHFQRIGINATKFEKKTLIHFESDVFNAVAVVDAKSGQRLRHTSLAGFDKGKEAYENYIEYYVM